MGLCGVREMRARATATTTKRRKKTRTPTLSPEEMKCSPVSSMGVMFMTGVFPTGKLCSRRYESGEPAREAERASGRGERAIRRSSQPSRSTRIQGRRRAGGDRDG